MFFERQFSLGLGFQKRPLLGSLVWVAGPEGSRGLICMDRLDLSASAFATLLQEGHLLAKLDVEVFTIAHILGIGSPSSPRS